MHLCNRLAPVPGRDLDDFSQLALVWEFQASNIYSTLELPTSLLTCNLLDVTSNQDPSRSNASLSALYREHANQTTARELLARSTAVCPSVCSLEDAYRLPALPFCRPSGELSDGATFLLASLVVACFCQLTILIYAVDNAKPLFASSEV